jgi:hypothetical protein
MHILRIEHPVPDYDSWKAAFDSDPVGRERSAVRRYRTTFFMLAYALSWWASILKPVLGHRKLKNLAPTTCNTSTSPSSTPASRPAPSA